MVGIISEEQCDQMMIMIPMESAHGIALTIKVIANILKQVDKISSFIM